MKKTLIAFSLAAAFLSVGCTEKNVSETLAAKSATAAELQPNELGQLGARIQAHPENAHQILSERGLTEAEFERAIRKVSEDPEASRQYAAAFRDSSS